MQKPSSPLSTTTSWFSVVVFVPQKLYFATKQLGSRRFPRFPSFNKPPDHHNHHHDHDHHHHDDHTQNTSPLSTEQHHDVCVHFDDHSITTEQPALVPAAELQGVVGSTSGPSTLPHDKSSPASLQPENGFSNVPSFASAIEILPITTSQDQFLIPCPNVQPNKPKRRSLKTKPNFKKKHPSFKLRISPRFLIPQYYISKSPNINSRVSSVSTQKKIVQINNPIIEMFREEQLGRNVMVLAIPIATGLMAYYNPGGFASLAGRVAAVALSLGTAAIWSGILLRRTWLSWATNASEIFGTALVLLSFFGYLGSRLPQGYIWVPVLCLVVCLVPLGMALCACGDQINGGEDYDHHHANVVVNVDHIV